MPAWLVSLSHKPKLMQLRVAPKGQAFLTNSIEARLVAWTRPQNTALALVKNLHPLLRLRVSLIDNKSSLFPTESYVVVGLLDAGSVWALALPSANLSNLRNPTERPAPMHQATYIHAPPSAHTGPSWRLCPRIAYLLTNWGPQLGKAPTTLSSFVTEQYLLILHTHEPCQAAWMHPSCSHGRTSCTCMVPCQFSQVSKDKLVF